MITLRPSAARGHFDHGWLDTYHSFSFGRYVDREHMGFRSLRVINEDYVAPGMGFGEHPHEDMEILTYVVSGAVAHKDSTGSSGTIVPGDVQYMSAGSGILHSEFNPSRSERLHLLQIWIRPGQAGLPPRYDQKHFAAESRRNRLALVASPDGRDGSIRINQDVALMATLLDAGASVRHELGAGRAAWVQVVKGEVRLNGEALGPGDAAALTDEAAVQLDAVTAAEVLVFDLV